jgi:hypothetical protein
MVCVRCRCVHFLTYPACTKKELAEVTFNLHVQYSRRDLLSLPSSSPLPIPCIMSAIIPDKERRSAPIRRSPRRAATRTFCPLHVKFGNICSESRQAKK